MSYRIITTDAVHVKEKIYYHSSKYQPPKSRHKRQNPTSEAVQKVNIKNAVNRLFLKLCANFTENDLYVTLKYVGDVNRSIAAEQMKTDMQRFQRLMRAEYRKRGIEAKIVYCFGVSENKVRHMHLVVSYIEPKVIQQIWKKVSSNAGRISYEFMWANYEYKGLAEYFIKNGMQAIDFCPEVFKTLYSCSRNLIIPETIKRTVHKAGTFRDKPVIDDGYMLIPDSVERGVDFFGFKYFKYLLRKIE